MICPIRYPDSANNPQYFQFPAKTNIVRFMDKPPTSLSISQALVLLLADTTSLFLKTWGYHWNVVGPEFVSLHRLFGDQYAELYEAVDLIAEQIRALGVPVPMDFFGSQRQDGLGSPTSPANTMITDLVAGHEAVLASITDAIQEAENAKNQGVLNMLASRQEAHDKHLWMLRALQSEK